MVINNNIITFSIILFRLEEGYKNKTYYTSSDFFLWDHRTDTVKEIELPGLKGKHMGNISNQERETLLLNILKKELVNIFNNAPQTQEPTIESTIHIYLNSFIYNKKIGGRYIKECLISLDNLINWSEISKAEWGFDQDGNEINLLNIDVTNANKFWKFYNEIIESPIYF
jgi:hypothetical protein